MMRQFKLTVLCILIACNQQAHALEDSISSSSLSNFSQLQTPSWQLPTLQLPNFNSMNSRDFALYGTIAVATAGTLYGIHRWMQPKTKAPKPYINPIIQDALNHQFTNRESIGTQTNSPIQDTLQNQSIETLSRGMQSDDYEDPRLTYLTSENNQLLDHNNHLSHANTQLLSHNNHLNRFMNDNESQSLLQQRAHQGHRVNHQLSQNRITKLEETIAHLQRQQELLQTMQSQENTILTQLNNQRVNPFQDDFYALYNEETSAYNTILQGMTTSFGRDIKEEQSLVGAVKNHKKNKTIANRMISPRYDQNPGLFQQPQKIILKVVHGTFANAGSTGGDINKPFSQALYVFAKQLALAQNATVKFDAFQWDSQLSLQERQEAGDDLAKEIKADRIEFPDAIIWAIGHSHGCNVINFAAQNLKKDGIAIDNAVFLASPVLDNNPLKSGDKCYNIKSLLNIWGSKDVTGALGSILSTVGTGATSELRKYQALHQDEIVRNVILKCDGRDLNHASIKVNSMHFLAGIIQYIGRNFLVPTNIIINVYDAAEDQTAHLKSTGSDESLVTKNSDTTSNATSPAPSPKNTHIENDSEDDDYIPKNMHANWVIQGVIDNKDPLQSQQLQKMLSPAIKASLKKSIELSDKNEKEFYAAHEISIHAKPNLLERFMDEFGNPIMNRIYSLFGMNYK